MKTDQANAGWCPNHGLPVKKKAWYGIMNTTAIKSGKKAPGGTEIWVEYSHRQTGWIQIWGCIVAIIIIAITSVFVPEILYLFIIATLALGAGLLIFSTLTVMVTEREIRLFFGPVPVIKRRIPYDTIARFSRVKNPWYYGWGIRWVPRGILYNIAGFDAIEIILHSGRRILIGTDDPEYLTEALGKVIELPE